MVVTIHQILRPLLITCFILGLGFYPMKQANPKTRWITYLSILYCLTVWIIYTYLFYYIMTIFTWNILSNIVTTIIIIINIFTAITSVIMRFYHQKKFEISLKKLIIVDDTLKELGVLKMYQKIHTCSKLVVFGWIVYSLVANCCDIIWWTIFKKTNSWSLFLAHIVNHSIHINVLMNLLFIFLLWFIGTRFDKINEHMQCLLIVRDKHKLRSKPKVILHQNKLYIDSYKRTFWTSMHLHSELCRIARELNIVFGAQITFGMVINLTWMTSLCYGLCMLTMKKLQKELLSLYTWFNVSFWFFIVLIRLYALNYICENVMIKANKIKQIIHQLSNTLRYEDIWKEIYQFTLQVMQHPLKLTGMGFFHLGNECLRKFCMTIVMFVIIMVQLKIVIDP